MSRLTFDNSLSSPQFSEELKQLLSSWAQVTAESERTLIRVPSPSEETVVCLRDLASRYPKEPSVYYFLGTALRRQGEIEAAVDEFRRLVECDALNPEGRLVLALTLAEAGRITDASRELEKAIQLDADGVHRAHIQLVMSGIQATP